MPLPLLQSAVESSSISSQLSISLLLKLFNNGENIQGDRAERAAKLLTQSMTNFGIGQEQIFNEQKPNKYLFFSFW